MFIKELENNYLTFYRYGYQGSEKDDELKGAGNCYTTYFREIDVRLGKFSSLDPMNQKFPWQSPYSLMDNNPISFNDPRGDEVKFAGKKEKNAYDSYKGEINNKISAAKNEVSRLQGRKQKFVDKGSVRKVEKFDKKIQRAQSKQDLYSGIENELNALESSSDIFRIRIGSNSSNNIGTGGNLNFNKNTDEVDVNVNSLDDIMGVIAHELKHAFQFIEGDVGLLKNGGSSSIAGYDKFDELEAYKRQQLFTSNITLRSYSNQQINNHIDKFYPGLNWDRLDITSNHSFLQIQSAERLFFEAGKTPTFITTGYHKRKQNHKGFVIPNLNLGNEVKF